MQRYRLPSRPRVWLAAPFILLPALLLAAPLPGCAEKQSPEARVQAFVAAAEKAAEARDLSALKEMIAEDYRDSSGRNRRGVMGILTVHFMRNESIHLLTRVGKIRLPAPARAEATVFVAMAGTPIPEGEDFRRLRADLYRFDVVLVEKQRGKWLLAGAEWGRATAEDFL